MYGNLAIKITQSLGIVEYFVKYDNVTFES